MIHKLISKVRFGPHESFGVDYRDVKAQNGKHFELTYNGWGTFDIPMTLYWTKESGLKGHLEVDHYLFFDGPGKWKTVKVQFSRTKLKAIKFPLIS